jgi:hypothetical protein
VRPYLINKLKQKELGGVQVVECLPSKPKTLISKPNTVKENKRIILPR